MSDDKAIDTPLQEAERQARKVATEYMYDLALHRHLPYALEDDHVKATRIGSQEPYSPGEVRYMPLLAVVVLGDEPLPAAFIKADITRERSQSLIAKQQEKDRAIWGNLNSLQTSLTILNRNITPFWKHTIIRLLFWIKKQA